MEAITLTGRISRVVHLNRNERVLQDIKSRLDDAYRDFLVRHFCIIAMVLCLYTTQVASALRLEFQQTQFTIQQTQFAIQQTNLATQQAQTRLDVKTVSADTVRFRYFS
jgi:hypothetical protein